jgi:kynurenine formamidase
MTAKSAAVAEAEIESYLHKLSNWGRWGEDDRLGTLNLITPDARVQATQSVRTGQALSLARDLDPLNPDPVHSGVTQVQRQSGIAEVEHFFGIKARWDSIAETITINPHGGNAHLDGLGHYYWDGKLYNGYLASDSSDETGSAHLAVSDAREGIVTRGVLLDIAHLFDVEIVERGYAVTYEDLLAAEKKQGVTVRAGDALLIHTGNGQALVENGPLFKDGRTGILDGVQSGLDISSLNFLRERDVAAMGADGTHDVQPSPFPDLSLARPIHTICLVGMGLWLMDNLDLSSLANQCREQQTWDFLFTALPWRFVGATSSPLNPVAVL